MYSAWLTQKDRARLLAATTSLETERARLERNKIVHSRGRGLQHPRDETRATTRRTANTPTSADAAQNAKVAAEIQPLDQRLAEVNALMKANQAKRELRELQTKIEFQSLIVQLFLQRRFEHVLIATRFFTETSSATATTRCA